MLQEQALKHAIDALESRQIGYMVVGSIASIAYSRPRMTLDIDIVVDLAPAQVPQLLAGFPSAEGYFHFEPAIVQSLIDNIPFNILHTATGLKWDFMPLRRDAYGRSEFARRQLCRQIAVTQPTPSPPCLRRGRRFCAWVCRSDSGRGCRRWRGR
jgi:hypothetical protein